MKHSSQPTNAADISSSQSMRSDKATITHHSKLSSSHPSSNLANSTSSAQLAENESKLIQKSIALKKITRSALRKPSALLSSPLFLSTYYSSSPTPIQPSISSRNSNSSSSFSSSLFSASSPPSPSPSPSSSPLSSAQQSTETVNRPSHLPAKSSSATSIESSPHSPSPLISSAKKPSSSAIQSVALSPLHQNTQKETENSISE